jgi:hypothetical protein
VDSSGEAREPPKLNKRPEKPKGAQPNETDVYYCRPRENAYCMPPQSTVNFSSIIALLCFRFAECFSPAGHPQLCSHLRLSFSLSSKEIVNLTVFFRLTNSQHIFDNTPSFSHRLYDAAIFGNIYIIVSLKSLHLRERSAFPISYQGSTTPTWTVVEAAVARLRAAASTNSRQSHILTLTTQIHSLSPSLPLPDILLDFHHPAPHLLTS